MDLFPNRDLINILDHGYVRIIETWGSDQRIIESARMSTSKGFNGWGPHHTNDCYRRSPLLSQEAMNSGTCGCPPGDEKLLKYLYDNKHSTPFEFGGMTVEIQAPIFVFREWHRHRTQSYSEMSARYTPLPDMNYIPTVERLMMNAGGTNRQAGTIADAAQLSIEAAEMFREDLRLFYTKAETIYQAALASGVPKELARVHLPVGRYSRMRATANLRNWLSFLTLRMDRNAQFEIRQYANAVGEMIAHAFPKTWELFSSAPPRGP